MKSITLLFLYLLTVSTFALTVEGLDIPATHTIEKTKLSLNGVGIRKATWFKVKVYVGSLYISKKTSNVEEILGSPYPKFLKMDFVRNVDKEKLTKGWSDGFTAALSPKDLKNFNKEIMTFNSFMRDIKKGQHIRIQFLKSGVNISFNNSSYVLINNPNFARALLSIWFIKPRDEGLAKGLKGLS